MSVEHIPLLAFVLNLCAFAALREIFCAFWTLGILVQLSFVFWGESRDFGVRLSQARSPRKHPAFRRV
jgi:hypothetical protein